MRWSQGLGIQAWFFEVPTRRASVFLKDGIVRVSVLHKMTQKMILYSLFLSPEHCPKPPLLSMSGLSIYVTKKNVRKWGKNDARWLTQQERFRRLEGDRWFMGAELSSGIRFFRRMMELSL